MNNKATNEIIQQVINDIFNIRMRDLASYEELKNFNEELSKSYDLNQKTLVNILSLLDTIVDPSSKLGAF